MLILLLHTFMLHLTQNIHHLLSSCQEKFFGIVEFAERGESVDRGPKHVILEFDEAKLHYSETHCPLSRKRGSGWESNKNEVMFIRD
jgi:hypothetical protein